MKVSTFDTRKGSFGINNVERVNNLELGLRAADFVSLHVDLNKTTRHLIGPDQFDLMKSTAFLINTSRGTVVDQQALLSALANGKIAGAGLDVLEEEPPRSDEPLLKAPNVIIVPHIGSATVETRSSMAECAVNNLLVGFRGETIPSEVMGASGLAFNDSGCIPCSKVFKDRAKLATISPHLPEALQSTPLRCRSVARSVERDIHSSAPADSMRPTFADAPRVTHRFDLRGASSPRTRSTRGGSRPGNPFRSSARPRRPRAGPLVNTDPSSEALCHRTGVSAPREPLKTSQFASNRSLAALTRAIDFDCIDCLRIRPLRRMDNPVRRQFSTRRAVEAMTATPPTRQMGPIHQLPAWDTGSSPIMSSDL